MTDRNDERRMPMPTRRRVVSLSVAALTTLLAGCNGDAGLENESVPTETASTSTNTTLTNTTPTNGTNRIDAASIAQSPTSHVAPTDGFADVSWLAEVPVEVVKVTTLDSSGDGSLRWALELDRPRIVVFEVGGVVDLGGESIDVTGSNLFVAGQTAPSPGITTIRGGISIDADDVFIQHIRVRPGDDISEPVDGIGNSDGSNVIVDHCSVSWATDEGISSASGADNPDVTFCNNLVAEALNDSIHPKGTHSYGTLVMDRSKRVTIAGNLWAHSVGRHPRLKGGSSTVVANNVAYNFERGLRLGGGVDDETTATIVGNYYRAGTLTSSDDPVIGTTFTDSVGPVRAYIAFNATDPSEIPVTGASSGITVPNQRPLWPESLQTASATEAYETVLASCGARPADRTPHDERVLRDVRERSGSIIDSQADVGGYPDLESNERKLEVPDEGFAEWLFEFTLAVESGE
ncbi:pectate lyase family protein [Haloprofundus salilacus]|uniref:pectate lyase family protein n=1 Tax=Haloprofundus salilacus TaxID=2876190 RepID=UPI001CC99376|nr:hypothetical protein [Haloprofundus salilacus]